MDENVRRNRELFSKILDCSNMMDQDILKSNFIKYKGDKKQQLLATKIYKIRCRNKILAERMQTRWLWWWKGVIILYQIDYLALFQIFYNFWIEYKMKWLKIHEMEKIRSWFLLSWVSSILFYFLLIKVLTEK